MGKKNKNNESIKVEFLGNSAVDVTQSCILLTFLGKSYLLECGMVQGYSLDKCYTLNSQLINSIKVENLECILVGHSHCDHIGMIPAIIKNPDFHGKVITTHETKEISRLLLLDSAHLLNKEAEALSKKKRGKINPLYRESDVYKTYENTIGYDIGKTYEVNENVSFKLLNNSHCLGACQIELYFKTPSNKVKKITYTSDVGSGVLKHKPFVKEMDYSTKNNLFIMEGTYGNKDRTYTKEDIKFERKDIKKNILNTIKNGGKILMPTFSFARTQEVLKDLYDMFYDNEEFGDTPVIIDSKLSVEITACYKKILQDEDLELINKITRWKNVKMNKDIKGTLANLASDKPYCVLSSQGFISAGHSQIYAKDFLECEKNSILFVGYCPENSVGGRIMNPNTKTVKIGDRTYKKRCFVQAYKTYSSHAQHDELLSYIKMVNTDKIVVHHSSKDAKTELLRDAKEELKKINKTTPIIGSYKNLVLQV